jgi:putative salt-induced outer membrane protein YdiY
MTGPGAEETNDSMRTMTRSDATTTRNLILALLVLGGAGVAVAQETTPPAAPELCPCPPPDPPPPLWTGSIGLSYLSNSGNAENESLGFTADFARRPTPWGLELAAYANQSETEGVRTAERLYGAVRGKRAIGERFELFGGLSWERNEFAGFDARAIVEAGGLWKVLTGPKHELAFDAGLTWTDEEPVIGEGFDSFGALAGALWVWKFNAAASFRERLVFYPNFDESDDWRLRSETGFDAAFAASWALRVSYLYTRDNLPAPGFEKADGSTSVSLVWKR